MVNPEPINFFRHGETDPDGGIGKKYPVGRFPGRGRKALGIIDGNIERGSVEDDRAGNDRPCQGTPTHLIQAGNPPGLNVMSALKPPIELKELLESSAVSRRLHRNVLQSECPSLFSCAGSTTWLGAQIPA